MTTLQKTLDKLEDAAFYSSDKSTIYTIQYGDTLSQIITGHYNIDITDPEYKIAEASALLFNQHIDDPDNIQSGGSIRLMPLPEPYELGSCPVPDDFNKQHRIITNHRLEPMHSHPSARIRDKIPRHAKEEQDAFQLLAYLQEERKALAFTGAGAMANSFANIVGRGNGEIIKEMEGLVKDYKNEKITQGQYSYRRQKVLENLKHRIGPLDKLFLGGKVNEKLRINRRKGIPATHNIERYATRIGKLSKYAKGGGYLLGAVGVYEGCNDIANTDDRHEKNEILVETVFNTSIGFGASAVFTIILISNPFGWVAAIALGVGAASAGYLGGKGAKALYNLYGQEVDIVSHTGIDKLCK